MNNDTINTCKMLGWLFAPSPLDSNEYWVATAEGNVFIASAIRGASNGWGNGDTWEDFDKEIIAYLVMTKPIFIH